MSQSYSRAAIAALIAVVILASPACRTKKKVTTTPPAATSTASTNPDTAPPDVDVPTTVTDPRDFIKETTDAPVTSEDLPDDIQQASRLAQERGWIQDAMFLYDASTLSIDAQEALAVSSSWLKAHRNFDLLIEGHCDERGTEQYNLALGDRRANTAKDYMVTLGVDASRIRTVSYGEERPFDQAQNEASWARNRRAHLVLVRRQ
ncbi:MAG TPA: OmpA family protein [Thermoanaerobaculia bacterium]|nr:OmpA family protein [Thermoanaerobaculia bacterium]